MTPVQTWNKAIEEAAKVAESNDEWEERTIPAHTAMDDWGLPYEIPERVERFKRISSGKAIAERIRALKPAASDVPGDDIAADTYPMPAHGWTCFHCGDTFKTPGSARDHFGFDPSSDPACRIKVGAERGLVMALRKAEFAAAEAWAAIGEESTEAARAYYAQSTRHREQIVAAEEAGYEKGLADGRGEAPISDELVAALERLEGLLEKATKVPWVRANLANVTTERQQFPDGHRQETIRYSFYDDALATEAVNSLPMLIDALKLQGVK